MLHFRPGGCHATSQNRPPLIVKMPIETLLRALLHAAGRRLDLPPVYMYIFTAIRSMILPCLLSFRFTPASSLIS